MIIKNAIAIFSLIPVRREPSEKSEMVTQILFGEEFSIMENLNDWCKVTLHYDGYEGYISQNMCFELKNPINQASKKIVINEGVIQHENNTLQRLSPGSELPELNNDTFQIDGKTYHFEEGKVVSLDKLTAKHISATAKYFLHTSYLWGGRTLWGIDCSGLVQLVFKLGGIKLPRDSVQQVKHGSDVSFVNEVREGDLAFFENEEGEIIHVGICLQNKQIIHAYGKVRIDSLDQFGIYNKDTNKYTHRLRLIKRLA